jgi:hypothetical protein
MDVRNIEAPTERRQCGKTLAARQRELNVVDMEMRDIEFGGTLSPPFSSCDRQP